jgi:hypothetical protein
MILAFSVILNPACSTIPPTETGGPRANQPAYPVLLPDDPERREATLAAARQILGQTSPTPANLELQPVTGTIHNLTTSTDSPVYLPKLGVAAEMTEEETRESLRRFIAEWQHIIGADAEDLSLVERADQPDKTKIANYEQRPFRYPLRGDFGKLQIRFTPDRRVLDINSTCIPNADKLQQSLATISAVVKPEDAVKFLLDKGISRTTVNGQELLRPAADDINPRELVFYVVARAPNADALEFHLAWEIEIKNAAVKTVYLDAVRSEVLAVM